MAEIMDAKNPDVVMSNDMGAFLARKIQNIGGTQTPARPATGIEKRLV